MLNNKLTDSEIIKAYEFCLNNKDCIGCVADKHSNSDEFDCLLKPQDIIDLFNRLQAENERLKPFEDKIAEFKSHIRVEDMLVFANSLEEWLEFCNNLKAEAYKECIEKVKAHYKECQFEYDYSNTCETLNNIYKELVGDE